MNELAEVLAADVQSKKTTYNPNKSESLRNQFMKLFSKLSVGYLPLIQSFTRILETNTGVLVFASCVWCIDQPLFSGL